MFSHALGSTSGDSIVRGLSMLLRGSCSERGNGVGDAIAGYARMRGCAQPEGAADGEY